jgi:hypothetical protein
MSTTVAISPQDVNDAANFLEQFLTDSIPDGDFSRGTSLRDLTIGALAAIYAFLRGENTTTRQMQSLVTVQDALATQDSETLTDAVTGILSNFFLRLRQGSFARGNALGHASQAVDIFIAPSVRFTRTAGVLFRVDSDTTYFIPRDQLVPIIDATGAVLEYQFQIPLVAVKTGETGNITPGLFASYDAFSPYVTRIENIDQFGGGKGVETVDEILARAPTAISVRNLINSRSISAVLTETFDEIRGLFVAGYGAIEMQRDRLAGIASHLAIHVGGKTDIYVLLDLVETIFEGTVGGSYARPDGVINVFSDSSVDFVDAGVQPGDIIRVLSGFPSTPAEYRVIEVSDNQLLVSEGVPFQLATDEQTPATPVQYTIGNIGPAFENVYVSPAATGVTSRHVSRSGRITLPGLPVMSIVDVAVTDPGTLDAALVDPADGLVHFSTQVNDTPTDVNDLAFETIVHNPLEAQSARQWMELVVGTTGLPARWDGHTLRVRYRTLAGFSAISDFVSSPLERTVAADQLVRAHHPITVGMTINYRLRADATAVLNESAAVATLVDYINTFDTSVTPIDMSSISKKLKDAYPTIATVFPFEIHYTLLAPTGQRIPYTTSDEVLISADKKDDGAPDIDHVAYGISSRTIRYLTNAAEITLVSV